jgi:magnesium transporter
MPRNGKLLPEFAGHLMVRQIAKAQAEDDAALAFRGLGGTAFACLQNLHVVDAGGHLLGVVPLIELAAAPPGSRVGALMRPARGLHEHDRVVPARELQLAAPPVVDGAGRLLGCIPPQVMLALGRRAHGRDVARMVGILHDGQEGPAHAGEAPAWRRAAARLPWLLLGLVGSAVMALLMAGFEHRLASNIAVAFFVPSLVFLADSVGTQTEVVVVRALSLGPVSFGGLVLGELATGSLIGLTLATLALPLVGFALGDWALASAVALALVAASASATGCGLLLPWAMSRIGVDPAFGSGPVASVFQDGLTLLVYFLMVLWILPA